MNQLSPNFPIKAMAAALFMAGIAFYMLKKKGVTNAAADVTSGALGVLGDIAGGVVIGAGDVLGIPRTNMTECERALAEGRTWDASFACPAKTFLGSFF
jgi:hypothetical protein